MEPLEPIEPVVVGGLVKVDAGGPALDGIVFDIPSRSKVVVAIMQRGRGPALRTVHPDVLTPREHAGPDDPALRLLIRRTPSPVRGAARGGAGVGSGRSGHTPRAAHRTTGR